MFAPSAATRPTDSPAHRRRPARGQALPRRPLPGALRPPPPPAALPADPAGQLRFSRHPVPPGGHLRSCRWASRAARPVSSSSAEGFELCGPGVELLLGLGLLGLPLLPPLLETAVLGVQFGLPGGQLFVAGGFFGGAKFARSAISQFLPLGIQGRSAGLDLCAEGFSWAARASSLLGLGLLGLSLLPLLLKAAVLGVQFCLPGGQLFVAGGFLGGKIAAVRLPLLPLGVQGRSAGLDLCAEGFESGRPGRQVMLDLGLLGLPLLPLAPEGCGLGRPVLPAGRPVVRCGRFPRRKDRSRCASHSCRWASKALRPASISTRRASIWAARASSACWASACWASHCSRDSRVEGSGSGLSTLDSPPSTLRWPVSSTSNAAVPMLNWSPGDRTASVKVRPLSRAFGTPAADDGLAAATEDQAVHRPDAAAADPQGAVRPGADGALGPAQADDPRLGAASRTWSTNSPSAVSNRDGARQGLGHIGI